MKEDYDLHRRPAREYQPGDRVWVKNSNITTTRPSKKLDAKRYGPFEVIEKVGRGAYRVKLPANWKERLHDVFNKYLLTPFVEPESDTQRAHHHRLPPEVTSSVPEYEVDKIFDSRNRGTSTRPRYEYKVLWKGYPRSEATWEPIANVQHAPRPIADFHRDHTDAIRPPSLRRQQFHSSVFPQDFFLVFANPSSLSHPGLTEPTNPALPSEKLLHRLTFCARH